MKHHAYVIVAEKDEGVAKALEWLRVELGMETDRNPDIMMFEHGFLSVEDSRNIGELSSQAPLAGETKALVISANRFSTEAQNAFLKIFEEPPEGTYIFLIVPSVGLLLPTLCSRVEVLSTSGATVDVSEDGKAFLASSKEKRTALISKLNSGKTDEERRANRDQAIRIVNGVEVVAYTALNTISTSKRKEMYQLLEDLQTMRGYLNERSAPIKMILEHISIVLPKSLSS